MIIPKIYGKIKHVPNHQPGESSVNSDVSSATLHGFTLEKPKVSVLSDPPITRGKSAKLTLTMYAYPVVI